MALTRYKILKRADTGLLSELGVHETNGPKQAMRRELESGTSIGPHETLVAIPEGNWTEQGARVRKVETVELFDPDELYADGSSAGATSPQTEAIA